MKIQKITGMVYLATTLVLHCWGDWYSKITEDLNLGLEVYTATFSGGCWTTEDFEKVQHFTTKLCEACNQHPETEITIKLQNIGFSTKEILRSFLAGLAGINNLHCLAALIYVGQEAITEKMPTIFTYFNPNTNALKDNPLVAQLLE